MASPDRVLVLPVLSSYGAVDRMLADIGDGLAACGFDVVAPANDTEADFAMLRDGCFKFALSVNGAFTGIQVDGRPVWDAFDVPLLTWLLDHPAHHAERLSRRVSELAVLTADETWAESLPRWGVQAAPVFFPHAGCRAGPGRASVDSAERDLDVLFVGSAAAIDVGGLRATSRSAAALVDVTLAHAADAVMPGLDALFDEAFAAAGLPDIATFRQPAVPALLACERLARHVRRRRMLEAAAGAGAEVVVVGSGWEGELASALAAGGRVRFLPSLPFDDAVALDRRAKVVLHSNPLYRAGLHERMLSAMVNGAACVAESNLLVPKVITDGVHARLFSLDALDGLTEAVAGLLADRPAREELARAGQAEVEAAHLWSHRAQMLAALLS